MNWQPVARKDYLEAVDSRVIRYLTYLFVIACLIGAYIFPVTTTGEVTTNRFAGFMSTAIGLLLPLVGLLLGYNAIVGERSSGRLNLLLSLPHTRKDVVIGKIVGRGLFLAAAVIVGLVGAAALVIYPFGSFGIGPAVDYVVYIGLTLLFGGIFFGIGLTLSTMTASKQIATLSAFGVFFIFVVIWDAVAPAMLFALERIGLADGELPTWAIFIYEIQPVLLYERIIAVFFEEQSTEQYLGTEASWYLSEWIAIVLFLLWVVLPLALGYRRFNRGDL